MRRIFIFACFLMTAFLFADGVQPSGTGTETNPYIISTLDNLLWLSTTPDVWDDNAYFLQTADIDASSTENWNGGSGFNPIGGWETPFTGHYNGHNNEITNLHIDTSQGYNISRAGFFDFCIDSFLKNIKLISINCTTYPWTGSGGLAVSINNTSVVNCHVTGTVTGYNCGGLIAGAGNNSTIRNCSSKVEIYASNISGGLLGYNSSNSLVSNCFYYGNMNYASGNCGGIIGENTNSSILCNSYSIITNSPLGAYALVGFNSGLIENCVWSSDFNNLGECLEDSTSVINNVIDCTETEMRDESTYISLGWDFLGETANGAEDFWSISSSVNNGYPFINVYPSVDLAGSGSETDPYLISSYDELKLLSNLCQEYNGLGGIYFLQTAVIDASTSYDEVWGEYNNHTGFKSIGTEANPFGGAYDGGGLSIDSLYAEGSLFGYATNAEIRNLNMTDIESFRSGIVEVANNIIMDNCSTSGHIESHSPGYRGGLISSCNNSTITNCTSESNVLGSCESWYNQEHAYSGGLFGRCENTTISNCTFTGTVTSSHYAAGIVSSCINSIISNCSNSGSIGVGINSELSAGLVVYVNGSTVSNCYSNGNVSSNSIEDSFGLICSTYNSSITNCYYDYETVLLNNEHRVTPFALPNDVYTDWIDNGMVLNSIDSYLDFDGTSYQINNFTDLNKLLAYGNNQDYQFSINTDIDLSLYNFFYIPEFKSSINGNGHRFQNFSSKSGFFDIATDCTISGIIFENARSYPYYYAGIICSKLVRGVITNCRASGLAFAQHFYIYGESSDDVYLTGGSFSGGLVGSAEDSVIDSSCFTGSIRGVYACGGIAGIISNTVITNSYSSIMSLSWSFTGGIVGRNTDGSLVQNCYSFGNFSQINSPYNMRNLTTLGGIVGGNIDSEIENCFASFVHDDDEPGGLIGQSVNGTITNCIWDTWRSGVFFSISMNESGVSENVIGATNTEMQDITTYTSIGWDFLGEIENGTEDIWTINPDLNNGYPYLVALEQTVGNEEETNATPELQTKLYNNYPNPFNPKTTIEFSVKKNDIASLKIFNIKGQVVHSYPKFATGEHKVVWQGDDKNNKSVASGVYFYRLESKTGSMTKKMMLIK